jgi:hypothetical protein
MGYLDDTATIPKSVRNGSLIVGTDFRNPGTQQYHGTKAYVFNAGIDFSIKRGILSGEFDVFRRDIKGLSAQRDDILILTNEITLPIEPKCQYELGLIGWLVIMAE